MKYQCCACASNFDGGQIQDDFKNGVKEGFLCPLCGQNIKDNLSGESVFQQKARGRHIFYSTLVIIFFLEINGSIDTYLATPLGINNWLVLASLIVFFLSVYLFANRDLFKDANVLTTQRVVDDNCMLS